MDILVHSDEAAEETDPLETEPVAVDEAPQLLIEELTIDGMCGVY
jgi:mycofactocin precursor